MLQSNNSLVTLAVILAVFGVSKPAKAISVARSDADYATYSVSNTLSQANVDLETVRDNPVNTDLEDSGSINSDLEGSGSINSDLEGSGEINRDIEGSGDFDSSFRESGSINSDLQQSGQANPDVEDSGTPLSTDDLDLEDAEISDSEVAPNNTVEGETPGAEIAEKKGSWWWWLIPVLGIPLLGLIIALGGRQRSDREPAIGNIPNRDEPNDGGLTTVGSDLSGSNNSGNVASATSRLGGAVATGGAAANVVGNSRPTESNLDLDLEQTDTIGEIPSNSVSEFTGQEARLQVDERSTNRQEIDRDFDPLVDSDSTAQSNIAARLGEVAASEPSAEGETTPPLTDEDNAVSTEPGAPLDVTRNQADEIDLTETTVEREFRGDYVLQEETSKPFTSVNVDTATDIDTDTENSGERLDAVDNTNTSKLDAIAESDPATEINSDLAEPATPVSEATTSEFSNPELNTPERESVDEFTIEEADNVIDLRQSDWDNPSETAEAASATPEIDLLSDEDDSVTDSASYADRATQGGIALGSATASGIFNREQLPAQQNVEESELELGDVPAETNRNVSASDSEANFNDVDFSLEEITFDESDSMDLSLDEITLDDSDRSVDSSLEDITLDESDSVDSTVDRDNASSVSLEEITFDESDSMDLSLDEITLDDSDRSVDSSLEEMTFDQSDSMDLSLDEITLDDSDRSVDSSLEEMTFDQSDSMDLSLDEITLDDSDRSVDSSLEEMTFDQSDSMDLSLDEITLDDSDRSVDSSLEDITDESLGSNNITKDLDETDNDRANLDDLGFAESESKDDLSFDLLSDNRADIAGLSDDNDDIDNITEWLDSLQTQRQDTDNISEWLDTLDTSDLDSAEENSNQDNTMELNEESEDVSFQFLEDLLERDSSPNDDER